MKAKIMKMKGFEEYFGIKLELDEKDFNHPQFSIPITLHMPISHYDMLKDPEAVISAIAKKINS